MSLARLATSTLTQHVFLNGGKINMSNGLPVSFKDVRVGSRIKIADCVSKPNGDDGNTLIYPQRAEDFEMVLWISSPHLTDFIVSNGSTCNDFNVFVSPNHPDAKLGERWYVVGKVVVTIENGEVFATISSLTPQWDEMRVIYRGGCEISMAPMAHLTTVGEKDYVTAIVGVEVLYRKGEAELVPADIYNHFFKSVPFKDRHPIAKGMTVEFTEEPSNSALDTSWKVTSVREIKPTQYATINKYHYGRVSLLGHVRQDAVRVDTGAPGRKAYMGSKDAIVRAIVDYRGAKLYVFNGEDKISHEEFLECVKMAGLDRIKDIEVWNNLNVKMVNDRLFFDGKRKSVKLHHEVDMEEFSERFTKNWFDTNYKEIYGFHSESIDRGTVRELRRLHGARKAELREGAGYNGPHS